VVRAVLDALTLVAILVLAARIATRATIGWVRERIKAFVVRAADDVGGGATALAANAALVPTNLVARTAVELVRQQISACDTTVLVIGNWPSVTVGVAQRTDTAALQADLSCITGLRTIAAVVVGGRRVKAHVVASDLGVAT